VALALGLVLLPAPARAQNREQQQLMADMRMLQEQVQQLRAAVNGLIEQVKTASARIDTQTETARKNAADQMQLVKTLTDAVSALREKIDSNSVQVGRLTEENDAIRQGLAMLQKSLSQALVQFQALAPVAPNAEQPPAGGGVVPAAPGAASGTGGAAPAGAAPPPAPVGANLPPSPKAYYDSAFGYYTAGQYDTAIDAFQDVVTKFPDSSFALDAQFFIGEAYYTMGRYAQARDAYALVISKYKDQGLDPAERVPDSYFKQGLCYEQLRQLDKAVQNYRLVLQKYPDSSAAVQAQQELKKLNIKD
jgi:tol-pal system protein YbgF